MKHLTWTLLALVALLISAGCADSDSDNKDDEVLGQVATEPPTATTEVVPTTPPVNDPVTEAIDVSALFDGEGAREAIVGGAVVWDRGSARLCEVLMESFPPQCGGVWVVIANPDRIDAALESTGEVRWTQSRVELPGRFDGDRFIVDFQDLTVDPSDEDQALADAVVGFAAASTPELFGELRLADQVALGLGSNIATTVGRDELLNPAAWSIDRDEFRAWAGPFSVLDVAAEPFTVTVGAHARCVAPPEPAPAGFEDHRRVSLQPIDATSCLEWWTIDLLLDDDGQVAAITLDLFAP